MYTLNVYSDVFQLFLNKGGVGKRRELQNRVELSRPKHSLMDKAKVARVRRKLYSDLNPPK